MEDQGRSNEESQRSAADAEPAAERSMAEFPVVGLGASAGGLAAFEAFFSAMPADDDPGMAFVLVQHLAPDHKSLLSELVRRYTRLQVREVEDGMQVQVNCAYIIPPNRDMALEDGRLRLLEPRAPRGQRLPIDFFFRSLAKDQRERAVGVVLSGTGSDGTLGVRTIKGEGGLVVAQDPRSAEYDGMPRSAIATGLVDYVLPPAEMPAQLIAYAAHAFRQRPRPAPATSPETADALKEILSLVRAQTGHAFDGYKSGSMVRRIERRMALHSVSSLGAYARYLRQTPAEVEALFDDLLIGVTSFFRDPEAYAALEEQIIPRLFAAKSASDAVRVWVAGCSTGEEAYSIAILLLEHREALRSNAAIQVFATDADSRAIEVARAGVYPASIAADVSPERLARHFRTESDGSAYRVGKDLRGLLVFSEQNVLQDPPFSRLDLVSCRNLLIYLGPELQHKLINLFHYALNPAGFLFLGNSESVGDPADRFAVVDRRLRLYQRKEDQSGARGRPAVPAPPVAEGTAPVVRRRAQGDSKPSLRELVERALLQERDMVGVLVDERGEILYLHGRTGSYLEPAPGEAELNALHMAREGLKWELARALRSVVVHGETAYRPGLQIKTNGGYTTIDLTVRALPGHASHADDPGMYLVILEPAAAPETREMPAAPHVDGDEAGGHPDPEARIAALQKELREKEEYVQASSEEFQTANEELTSANEELQSVNEELQSANEELETSKEELQSVNEELITVNAELQARVAELSQVSADMSNLLAGTGIATLFVDRQLHIRRFTPAITELINLIPTDVGRPVGDIVANLVGYDGLEAQVQAVLDTLVPQETEVQARAGGWYLLRIGPYRSLENVIEGAVITLTDITEVRKARDVLRESEDLRRLAALVRDAHDAILMQDLAGRILAWNPGAERMYGWSEAEALGMNIRDLTPPSRRANALAEVRRLSQGVDVAPYHTERVTRDGRSVPVWVTATALADEHGEVYAIATTEREIPTEANL